MTGFRGGTWLTHRRTTLKLSIRICRDAARRRPVAVLPSERSPSSRIKLVRARPICRPTYQEVVREAEDAAGEAWGAVCRCGSWPTTPDTLRAFNAFYFELFANDELGMRVTELVRLAIAQMNRCPNCMAARYTAGTPDELPDDVVAALPAADRWPAVDEREKAACARPEAGLRAFHGRRQ